MKLNWSIQANWMMLEDSGCTPDIPSKFREELEEHAFERAMDMSQDGFVEGELSIIITDSDDNDVEFRGWWSIQRSLCVSHNDLIESEVL